MADLQEVLDNADEFWREPAERALQWWAEAGVEFDAFDLVQIGVPEPDSPNRWGPLFHWGRAQGLIEPVGYRPARRPSRHGGVVRVWRGKQAA